MHLTRIESHAALERILDRTPDVRLDPLQPDFTLAALPTSLRLPANKLAFRVTHRFLRALNQGDVGDLFANFFGFDNGAQIGLELRYGIRPGTQIVFYRTSDRSIQLLGQQSVLTERDGHPIGRADDSRTSCIAA